MSIGWMNQFIFEFQSQLFQIIFGKLMPIAQLKKLLGKISFAADMFKAPASLRARGQQEFSRLCPGVLSVALGVFFWYVLLLNFTQLLEYKKISSVSIRQAQQNISAPHFQNISVSFSPSWQDYTDWTRKFYVNAILIQNKKNKVQTKLQLQKCKPELWPDFQQQFSRYFMKQSICIKSPQQVKLQGTNLHSNMKFLQLQLKRCNDTVRNDENFTCMTDAEFNDSFVELSKKKYNFFSLHIKDTSINSKKQNPLQQHLTVLYHFPYDHINRKTLNLYLGTYTIETQTSIWPYFPEKQIKTGYFVSGEQVVNVYKKYDLAHQDTEWFGIVNIYMSTNKIRYLRNVGDITQTISYVGGLFGLIVVFFNFFVYSYNKYCYELLVAESSFNYEQSGQKVRFKYFSFFKYIKFQVYYWLKRTFNRTPKWTDCQMTLNTKDEANLYLDVEYLFRKLRLIDLGICRLVRDQEVKMLYLTEPPCLSQVEERRMYLEYYNSIIEGKLAVNIQDLRSQDFRINQLFTRLIGGPSLFIIPTENTLEASPAPLKPENDAENLQLIHQFRSNLKIQDEKVLESMVTLKDAYYEVKEIQLDQRMSKAEQVFARTYLHANKTVRNQILDKIPLKILFRLNNCIAKLKASQNNRQIFIQLEEQVKLD